MGEARTRGTRGARVQAAILGGRGKPVKGLNLQKNCIVGLGKLTLWLVNCAAYDTQTIMERGHDKKITNKQDSKVPDGVHVGQGTPMLSESVQEDDRKVGRRVDSGIVTAEESNQAT